MFQNLFTAGRWPVLALCTLLAVGCQAPLPRGTATPARPPNIVIIFCDDMGYADIAPFGGRTPTPHLSRMADEGMRFTDFYVAQAVCSASRAALLTGCYPNRVGVQGAFGPRARVGLGTNETTLASMLKARGYATAIYGKWHLGDAPAFLPTRHGFDEWFGIPYSHDMWPFHPTATTNYPPLPLYENERIVQIMPDPRRFTGEFTRRAVDFIGRQKDRPFFLYLPHPLPHVPLYAGPDFNGTSGQGLYADVIQEIDWSVGQILTALQTNGLDENTLVIFTSDNGPWLLYGSHAGDARPLREGKATTFDGGVRVPCLMRWPGTIPGGRTCREMALTMDLLPTIAGFTGARAPEPGRIDGRDIRALMTGQRGARTPHEAYFYYWGTGLEAVRSGPWKLHLAHNYVQPAPPGGGGLPGKYATRQMSPALFHLKRDIGEQRDLAARHPEVVARLEALADRARADLGDSLTKRKGTGVREPGRLAPVR